MDNIDVYGSMTTIFATNTTQSINFMQSVIDDHSAAKEGQDIINNFNNININ